MSEGTRAEVHLRGEAYDAPGLLGALLHQRDGPPDGREVNTTRTNPIAQDSDHDGLTDGAEVKAGSNPLNIKSGPGHEKEHKVKAKKR